MYETESQAKLMGLIGTATADSEIGTLSLCTKADMERQSVMYVTVQFS